MRGYKRYRFVFQIQMESDTFFQDIFIPYGRKRYTSISYE